MLELFLCSLFTVVPDFLYRRFAQGKRIGKEINLYSVWFELRWGLTSCFMLTVSLITLIFYFHPSTTSVSSYFRTVTVLPETSGRVVEIYAKSKDDLKVGDPIFRLDDSSQSAALETAKRKIDEVDAATQVATSELAASEGTLNQALGGLTQAEDELARQLNLQARNPDVVSGKEVDRLKNLVESRKGAVEAAAANQKAVQTRIEVLYPAQRASAQAALEQAQAELDKTLVAAGVNGTLEQFQLQVGDYVSAVLRPAGILVPDEFDDSHFIAGFGQLASQVIKPGMVAEVSCLSHPFKIIPMQITSVQDVISAGQFRPSDRLLDIQDATRPGTLTVNMEPLFPDQADPIPPGSSCVANAYTNNHELLDDPSLPTPQRLFLHTVDTVGIAHALLLRIQVILLPVQTLVFSGGH